MSLQDAFNSGLLADKLPGSTLPELQINEMLLERGRGCGTGTDRGNWTQEIEPAADGPSGWSLGHLLDKSAGR